MKDLNMEQCAAMLEQIAIHFGHEKHWTSNPADPTRVTKRTIRIYMPYGLEGIIDSAKLDPNNAPNSELVTVELLQSEGLEISIDCRSTGEISFLVYDEPKHSSTYDPNKSVWWMRTSEGHADEKKALPYVLAALNALIRQGRWDGERYQHEIENHDPMGCLEDYI